MGQLYDCPGASEVTSNDTAKLTHDEAQTVFIILGLYCSRVFTHQLKQP